MTRHPDWPERLAGVVECWREVPFKWGTRDCAHFALAGLTAVSSRDWSALAPEPYHSPQGAARVLKKLGVNDITALADALLGPRCAPAFIRRGDLVELKNPDGPALGICVGERVAAMAPKGLTFKPLSEIASGWRI